MYYNCYHIWIQWVYDLKVIAMLKLDRITKETWIEIAYSYHADKWVNMKSPDALAL